MRPFRSSLAIALALAANSAFAGEAPAVRGIVKARAEATVAVDFTARVIKVPFKEGERFNKGDLLAAFDCTRYSAEVAAARASLSAGELQVSNNKRLQKHGAIASHEVDISVAQAAKARAEMQALVARNGQCDIRAPFPGRIAERMVNPYESPPASQPLFHIVDDSSLELEVIVPSKWLVWIEVGATFSFAVDETGETAAAKITRLGAAVDPVSQTIKVYGVLAGASKSVLPGMSGTATFQTPGS